MSPSDHTPTLAPGAHVLIRDEEWRVRRVDPSADGGRLLTCDGISELVRGRVATFLTKLEGPIELLDPVLTTLVPDTTARYAGTLLAIDLTVQPLGHRVARDPVMREISRVDLFFRPCQRRILPIMSMVITPRPLLHKKAAG